MRKITPPRKIKARLQLLMVLVGIFLATLIICRIVFTFSPFSGTTLLSPITKTQAVSQDANIAEVQAFCLQSHIACVNVQSLNNSSIQIILDTNALIVLSTKKDLKNQLSSLQEALQQFTIKGKQFKKLDFRFANIVVTF